MSTRSSIFYHDDQTTGVNIHVYEELSSEVHRDIRLEIEFEHGTINIAWPKDLPLEEVVKLSIKSYERQPFDPERFDRLTPFLGDTSE